MTHLLTVERALDVRGKPGDAAASEALARFDALDRGERFVLVAGDGGVETLRKLQAERPEAFEWSPLAYGPPVWRIEIARREPAKAGGRGVEEALSWDHDRLDALEQAAFEERAAGDLQAAFDLYAQFALGLRRHIGFEEEILFPSFEELSGMPPDAGPTAVMRAEHREIERLLDEIAGGIGDAAADVDAVRADLHRVLGEHNLKEEGVLYPTVDQRLGADGADRLVGRIQRYGG
jgi:uncharacterized protein (DUF2249 family)/hemerythrin-like domain-containing protein